MKTTLFEKNESAKGLKGNAKTIQMDRRTNKLPHEVVLLENITSAAKGSSLFSTVTGQLLGRINKDVTSRNNIVRVSP